MMRLRAPARSRRPIRSARLGRAGHGELTRIADPPSTWRLGWLPLIAVLLLLLWWLWPESPRTLTQLNLSGPRSPACVRLVILPDQSGSMDKFASARDDAFAELVPWAITNLRPDDELAVIDWASTAALASGPVRVDEVPRGTLPSAPVDRDGTELSSAVDAVAALPVSACHTSLVFLTDTLISPVSAQVIRRLADATVTSVTVVLPDGASVSSEWTDALPFSQMVISDAHDADATARSLGQAVAFATGQQLSDAD